MVPWRIRRGEDDNGGLAALLLDRSSLRISLPSRLGRYKSRATGRGMETQDLRLGTEPLRHPIGREDRNALHLPGAPRARAERLPGCLQPKRYGTMVP